MSSFKPAIPTMSLGHGAAGHSMRTKLEAAAAAGFQGIEVFYACLESFSTTLVGDNPRDKLREAAKQTGVMIRDLGMECIVLQPILNYEGIKDEQEHRERVDEIVFRFELCHLLGCNMLQIPANFRLDDGVTGDEDKVVADLREIADLAALESPPIHFAYEAMCWSTFAPTWQDGWRIVQLVDRPNFSMVIDAFHIAGYECADPTVPGGVRPDGEARLAASLEELVRTLPGEKVLYAQLVDAERLDIPLAEVGDPKGSKSPFYTEGVQPRCSWSRNARLFPYEDERGGYLPIQRICQAFVECGFKGWISFELFTRFMSDASPSIPKEHAERGKKSWETLKKNLQL